MLTGVTAAFLISLQAQAAQPQWRVAAVGGDAPHRTVFFVDAANVEREGDTVRFWTQTILEEPVQGGTFDRSVVLREGDCRAMASAMVRRIFYLNGTLAENDDDRGETTPHPHDSMMGGVMEAVCGKSDYASPPVPDPEGTTRSAFRESR